MFILLKMFNANWLFYIFKLADEILNGFKNTN
ncbi:hypothetical protein NIES4102_10640 [Chondrocystis sp. NIES-4102]|nr:hypothetical protein NIES4102_10640 [Chondrocystis sp. NIES-4102]